MIRVAIIDDNKIARVGIRNLLVDDEIEIIGEAANGREGVELAASMQPDVVILDLYLPDIPGIKVCQMITKKSPSSKIIFITANGHLQTLCRLLNTPAKGLMRKDASFSSIEAVKAVHQGITYIQPNLAYALVNYMRENSQDIDNLSDKEHQVLMMLAQGKSQEKIAEDFFISPKTVSNIKFRAMKKMNLRNIDQIKNTLLGTQNF